MNVDTSYGSRNIPPRRSLDYVIQYRCGMIATQTVLVVDDEPMVREVLAQYLTHDGFTVVEAADGEEAVAKLDECAPDLVLLDLMLPKKHGLEVLRHARTTSDVPVILLTALGDEKDRVAGLELGADDYVVKPFSPREVAARVKSVLRRSAGPAIPVDLDLWRDHRGS